MEDHNDRQHFRKVTFELISKGGNKKELLACLELFDELPDLVRKEFYTLIKEELEEKRSLN